MMNKRILILMTALSVVSAVSAQQWPAQSLQTKPGARWWWLGSALNEKDVTWNMDQYASHGLGTLEITPLYGVQGNDKNDIPYLSPRWMEMLRFVEKKDKELGIETGMATGTGWPFGGPWVPLSEAACKAVFVDTIVDVKKKLMDINFTLPEKERDF